MRKLKFVLYILFVVFPLFAQSSLGEDAQVSLLTSSPDDSQVFTLYGHTALRIKDTEKGVDLIFNYGIFDFSQSDFIYRFVKGETDYQLGVMNFQDYIIEYQMRGSEVVEQVLNLTSEEKSRIWTFLLKNYEPQNRVYRYNFFFDNCSTRPRDIIEKSVDGRLSYTLKEDSVTFRDLISYCTRNHDWITFGCDLALGGPTDNIASAYQKMFLPSYLKEGLAQATVIMPDGSSKELVKQTVILAEENLGESIGETIFLSPMVLGILLLIIFLTVLVLEYKKKKHFWWIDSVLFFVAGIAGSVLFFLAGFSEHPCVHPNWSLVWLNPIQLIASILFLAKRAKIASYYYHFINFAVLTLFLMFWNVIPQALNVAFIPYILILWSRSLSGGMTYVRLKRFEIRK